MRRIVLTGDESSPEVVYIYLYKELVTISCSDEETMVIPVM